MKNLIYLLIPLLLLSSCSGCRTYNTAQKMIDNGYNTIYKEFKPEELLRKYTWFKDASAQLDAKIANIQVYENKFKGLKSAYGKDSLNRRAWARDDREQYNNWQSEYSGLVASYNDLASEYNSAMAKFNYAFCNAGSMPESNMTPLPRNFKPYLIN